MSTTKELRDAGELAVERVEEIITQITPRSVSQYGFFEPTSIWSIEVPGTCAPVIELYHSVNILIEEGMLRTASVLSRSIHQAYIRFEYLTENEHELQSWMEWLMSNEYYQNIDYLQYDVGTNPEIDEERQLTNDGLRDLLGGVPTKLAYPWRPVGSMINNISNLMPVGARSQLSRRLIEYPSEYVHVCFSTKPTPESVLETTELYTIMTLQQAMHVCEAKRLVPREKLPDVQAAIKLCEGWLEATGVEFQPQQSSRR